MEKRRGRRTREKEVTKELRFDYTYFAYGSPKSFDEERPCGISFATLVVGKTGLESSNFLAGRPKMTSTAVDDCATTLKVSNSGLKQLVPFRN